VHFSELELSNVEQSDDERVLAFKHLAEMQRLDWDTMRSNIASMVASTERATLPELLHEHPPTGGTIEVLGYLQLAHDEGHEVDENEVEVVHIGDHENSSEAVPYQVPRVVFISERIRVLRTHLVAGGLANG
jgi:hypothetical protein